MLVRWPGHIVPGERKQFGSAEDVLPTLLDLSGIPATVVQHLPFTGVSLSRSLNDAAATVERPEVFRIAIAGPGSPRDGIADVHDRKYEDHHLTLRGPRFRYHALPGGKSALYDIEADPGETSDVQAKFPDIASRMAKECRERWQSIIDSNRAFVPPPPPPTPTPETADKPAKVKAAD
jgi:arylsulfatase A-like enzyme